MMQMKVPTTGFYTGETHTVKEFAKAFNHVDPTGRPCLTSKIPRPNEVHHLLGDASKQNKLVGNQKLVLMI